MPRASGDVPFVHAVQPRYYEADQQGVVFNMWYLGWFDEAMSAYLGSLGFPIPVMTGAGWDVQLVHTELDWGRPVRFGDEVDIEVTCAGVGTTSFTLVFRVLCGGDEYARASTVYVVIGVDGSGKRPVPPDLRTALAAPARSHR